MSEHWLRATNEDTNDRPMMMLVDVHPPVRFRRIFRDVKNADITLLSSLSEQTNTNITSSIHLLLIVRCEGVCRFNATQLPQNQTHLYDIAERNGYTIVVMYLKKTPHRRPVTGHRRQMMTLFTLPRAHTLRRSNQFPHK